MLNAFIFPVPVSLAIHFKYLDRFIADKFSTLLFKYPNSTQFLFLRQMHSGLRCQRQQNDRSKTFSPLRVNESSAFLAPCFLRKHRICKSCMMHVRTWTIVFLVHANCGCHEVTANRKSVYLVTELMHRLTLRLFFILYYIALHPFDFIYPFSFFFIGVGFARLHLS